MKNTLFLLVVCLCIATPCLSEPDTFTTDKPSPLTLVKPEQEDGGPVQFRGQVQLSGQFRIGWELVNRIPRYLRAIFLPDKGSADLLPHAKGSGPVNEVFLSNSQEAISILLDQITARRIVAKELLSAKGEATVIIGEYATVVECDHRWYMARLISALKKENIAVNTEQNEAGC